MKSERYFLGIDGGQSSTIALIADEDGYVVGRGVGGPCNHVTGEAGRNKFFAAVTECLDGACRGIGLDRARLMFGAACLGFSGGAADKDGYARELIRSRRFHITHDAEIALAGATAGEPGIIVIAGTGSMAYGRNVGGKTARAGGWGYVFGDEGGAFDITRKALRAALRLEEGWGPGTRLREMLLEATGAPDVNALLHSFYTPEFTRQQIAGLSRLVSKAAEDGDEIATQILRDSALELVNYAEGVFRTLFMRGVRVQVAHAGGVFQSTLLRERFAALVETKLGLKATKPLMSPAAGALLTALRLAGRAIPLTNLPESEK
ncbi:MAG: BadF/BadG/BcrA/BcrD ATPase family protein [Bryobacteraceae bacterium]